MRMERQSCLTDLALPVVADTSVVINLTATQYSEAILNALPNRFLVVSQVTLELKEDRQARRDDSAAFDELATSGQATIVQLGKRGMQRYSELVSGPAAQTLDDGEAATIAYALEHSAIPLIDERKANRICAQRFAELSTASTVDLLAHDNVQATLGYDRLATAVFNALYHGRMRVLPHHLSWVVDLLGLERARQCRSLPTSARSG